MTKLRVKIRNVLAVEGIKPPTGLSLFTVRGEDWLSGIGLEPSYTYFFLVKRVLSCQHRSARV